MTRRPPAGPVMVLLAFLTALVAALLLVHTARGQSSPEPGTRNPEQREVSAAGFRLHLEPAS
jgi:hypothetical protein